MKAVVHFGMPKTGSTAIQSWLIANQEALAEKGVVYDRLHFGSHQRGIANEGLFITMKDMVGALVGNKWIKLNFGLYSLEEQHEVVTEFRSYFDTLMKQVSGDVMVFSSEFLGGTMVASDQITALDSWLSEYFEEVTYLVYLRRQEDWLPSSYSQRVKRGVQSTLDEVIDAAGEQDWHAKVAVWAAVVGRERLSVRLLEREFLAQGDLLEDFAQQLGITAEGMEQPARNNEALSAPATLLLAEINKLESATDETNRKRNPLRQPLHKAILQDSGEGMPKIKLTAQQVQKIRDVNADSNEQLRQAFLPDIKELFPARKVPDPQMSTPEDVATLAARLMVQLQVRHRKTLLDKNQQLAAQREKIKELAAVAKEAQKQLAENERRNLFKRLLRKLS
ncbi:hypothetical protein KO498_02460 [Lentibacter algarum]|uniref:hypothetical protein n=1 Tax=Lentibacter algarum TaxID=576131 RepID=UPI001C078DAA|nr:hypothetical protein [Lentibacter algarum]MBU2980667.1 hypothetical protein [Lentibacter algarum]